MGAVPILTEGLTKEYPKGLGGEKVMALKDLNLSIGSGEIFGLLGPNGSGKTTAIKILLGLLFPTRGKASILGRDVKDTDVKQFVGYLPESPYFYEFLTPVEVLDYYGKLFGMRKKERLNRIDELLNLVGLAEYRRRRLRAFSKGMLQRIGLASALINDPQVLFLDEPTIGLDPIGSKEIKDLLTRLRDAGKTILLSSHLLSEVEKSCNRIGILYRGELIKVGGLDDLLSIKDELQIVVREVGPDAKERIKKMIKQEAGEVIKFDHPRESLESLFMELIQSKIREKKEDG